MRYFFIALSLTLACALPQRQHGRTVAQQYSNAVQIAVACGEDLFGGSGVIVGPRTILTAYHVVACNNPLVAVLAPGVKEQPKTVKVLSYSESEDLALLELSSDAESFTNYLPVSYGPLPKLGDRVCGAHGVPKIGRVCGEVQPYADKPGDIVFTGIVDHGNSGSGLYDSHGRLVGIITHLYTCSNGQVCGGKATSLDGHGFER
jgi:S1-C subfamily serine protease